MADPCCPPTRGGARYSPLFSGTPLRLLSQRQVFAVAVCVTLAVVGVLSLLMHASGCQCECEGAPPCETWSCRQPLAKALHDEWPSWPVAAEAAFRIPRDNLPSADAEARWRALHRQQTALAAAATPSNRVAFFGDSITEGWLRSGFSGRAPSVDQPQCAAIWRATFGDPYGALNFAIGGDRAQDVGWRLHHGLLPAALQPRAAVLMIGTNDLGTGEQWDVVAMEVETILEQFHSLRPHAAVVLHAVLPRGGDDGTPRTPAFHRSPWWKYVHGTPTCGGCSGRLLRGSGSPPIS